MMETKHTVEPWHIDKYGNVKNKDSGHIGIRVHGFALSYGAEAEANARRIVACVNACAGVQAETLERVPLNLKTIEMVQRIESAEKQRDQLLEALEEARMYVDMAGENFYNPVANNLLKKIDAAIAAAKGEV